MRIRLFVAMVGIAWIGTSCTSSKKNEPVAAAKTTTAAPQVVAESKPVQSKAVVVDKKMVCERTKDQRVIEVEPGAPVGCTLWYSKMGSRTSVASSRKGKNHCENVLAKIGENLKNAGFECVVDNNIPVTQVASEGSELSLKKADDKSKTSESKKTNN